jgi:hypothetical protein
MSTPGPETLGPCHFCGDPVFGRPHESSGQPAHPCCEIHSMENPGEPCIACAAAKQLARTRRRRSTGPTH